MLARRKSDWIQITKHRKGKLEFHNRVNLHTLTRVHFIAFSAGNAIEKMYGRFASAEEAGLGLTLCLLYNRYCSDC